MATWPLVHRYRDAPDRHRVDVRRSPDGTLFRHYATDWMDAAPEDEGALGDGFWTHAQMSGYFGSVADCDRDARRVHGWIEEPGTTRDLSEDMDGADR